MIHQRILEALDYAGINQAELARLTGLNPSSISLLVRGLRTPEKRTLVSIANACSVNYEWLADGTGPMAPDNAENDCLAELAKQFNLSERDRILIEAFLSLPPQYREGVVEYAEALTDRLSEKREDELEERAEALKQSFLSEQRGKKAKPLDSFTGNIGTDEESEA